MSGGNSYAFKYNDNGIRTEKIKNNVTTKYHLNGTQIEVEQTGGVLYMYLYDALGSPIGMQYRDASYGEYDCEIFWFEKNLQGDVVAVYGADGTKLVSYVYDAWGNQTVTYLNGGENTAAVNNPFRYRGYYYDNDLGLYYLNSRYYDSKVGRFISSDGCISTGQGLTGFNMFAYCNNNPVNRVDGNGDIAGWIAVGILVAAVIVTGANHIVNRVNEKKISKELDNMESNGIDFSNKDDLTDEMNNILDEFSKEGIENKVEASFNNDNLEISNSYLVKDRYTRQKISMMYVRSGKTVREYDNLSAEWNLHNIVHPIKSDSTKNAELEAVQDSRWYVRLLTKFLEVFGWD